MEASNFSDTGDVEAERRLWHCAPGEPRSAVKILVVDDDPEIANLLTTVLSEGGNNVASVATGSAALAAALQVEYDLLVCDLMLPDLQGTEIVRAVKAQSPRLPIIVVSALEARDWAKPVEDAGATRYFQKPISLAELRAEVDLVRKARLHLRIAIVDPDPIHGTRLTKALSALGCEVRSFPSAGIAQATLESDGGAGLLVIDAATPGAVDMIRWAKGRGIPAFACAESTAATSEDELMRAGAAFMLSKPIDIDALLTQAAFMLA
jgi:DNA-binding response OmpR family regulator